MAPTKILLVLCLVYFSKVESAGLFEKSYEYVVNIGKSVGPGLMSLMDCLGEEDVWNCAKQKAAKLLDTYEGGLENQRRSWQEAADAEVTQSGRLLEEQPSKIGGEVMTSLNAIAGAVQDGVARSYARHHEGGGIDSITVSTSDKKKKKKKPSLTLVHVPVMKAQEKGQMGRSVQSWVIGHEDVWVVEKSGMKYSENKTSVAPRGLVEQAWVVAEKALDSIAEHAVESDNTENGIGDDKSSITEQRGKKKKKKKAILKLLILGAVLKAKIGTLLQILSFKLQVKFFLIALLGLGINLARFWLDLKKSHQHQPQKVIYYEHASHQHHYDEHDEHPHESGWGPWARNADPEEADIEVDFDNHDGPYRAQERNQFIRPAHTRA